MPLVERQIAALPVRLASDGSLEVFLVTSRSSGRWIIPKGNPIRGLAPPEVAAREALEEAGLVGRVNPYRLGTFELERLRRMGAEHRLVDVYALHVERQLRRFDEQGQREVLCCDAGTARTLVSSPSLGALIESYAMRIGLAVVQCA